MMRRKTILGEAAMADSDGATKRRLVRGSGLPGVVIVSVLLAAAASAYAATGGFSASAREPITRHVLARSSNPVGARGRTLGLSRVIIAPGAAKSPQRLRARGFRFGRGLF
jgi:hypothetical protein